MSKIHYRLQTETGAIEREAYGRVAWTLKELVTAGPDGCTPIDNPAPRWSAYVHLLRHEHGLSVETIYERHGGDYPGVHARYVLRSQVELIPPYEVS